MSRDPGDSLKPLEPPRFKLVFGLEVNFTAELTKAVFIQTDLESVGHVLLERMRTLLHLNCQSHGNRGDQLVLEGADVQDPDMAYYLNDAEKQSLNLICPEYLLNADYGWEDDIRSIFSCHRRRLNPIHAHDIGLDWTLEPDSSLRIFLEDRTNPGRGFSFGTIRNLAMILLLFGPKIDSMVKSKVAQEDSIEIGAETWKGPKPLPEVYSDLRAYGGKTPREMAAFILHQCHDIEAVCEAMEMFNSTLKPEFCECFAADFSGLLTHPPKRLNPAYETTWEATPAATQAHYAAEIRNNRGPHIMFKHQPGTLDGGHIIHWIRFLGALTEFANHIGMESIILFLGLPENGYHYFIDPGLKGRKLRRAQDSDSEEDIEEDSQFKGPTIPEGELNLRTWDFVRWHPTLAGHVKRDPPDFAADASFQHTYPIRALIAAMDIIGTPVELDTSNFWLDGLIVRYNPNMESDTEPELPKMKNVEEDDDDDDDDDDRDETEELEEMKELSMTASADELDSDETEWLPNSGDETDMECADEEDLLPKRRKLNY
ncbi:hypothetical protein FQN54_004835 [Arachnomyces sp. PD_36]|nr:hypothetical protein FQN54_004835 [Arachnomyces sp. PD_36]